MSESETVHDRGARVFPRDPSYVPFSYLARGALYALACAQNALLYEELDVRITDIIRGSRELSREDRDRYRYAAYR